MTYDIDNDPHMDTSAKKLARKQRKEPWGKVLVALGMEPYHTESSARRVAEYAAELEAERNALRRDLQRVDQRINLYERYLSDCVGEECCKRQARIHELEAVVEELGINNPTLAAKHCVNCTSEDLVPAPPELNSRRSLKCNQCGYLQD